MPDGSTTDDVEVYAKAWTELGEKVAKFFPGYVADAFNPGVRMTKWNTNALGHRFVEDNFNLSTSAALLLVSRP